MKSLNFNTYNIDREGDAIFIEMNIYNSERYELLIGRMRKTHAVIEIVFHNVSQKFIEVHNPELVVCNRENSDLIITKYNSSLLETQFPMIIDSQSQLSFGYDSEQIKRILEEHEQELIVFQIKDSNEVHYRSRSLYGNDLEQKIRDRNMNTIWHSTQVYAFDHKI